MVQNHSTTVILQLMFQRMKSFPVLLVTEKALFVRLCGQTQAYKGIIRIHFTIPKVHNRCFVLTITDLQLNVWRCKVTLQSKDQTQCGIHKMASKFDCLMKTSLFPSSCGGRVVGRRHTTKRFPGTN